MTARASSLSLSEAEASAARALESLTPLQRLAVVQLVLGGSVRVLAGGRRRLITHVEGPGAIEPTTTRRRRRAASDDQRPHRQPGAMPRSK
jgi:hypothetical protein